jgi:hypothetical protein
MNNLKRLNAPAGAQILNTSEQAQRDNHADLSKSKAKNC